VSPRRRLTPTANTRRGPGSSRRCNRPSRARWRETRWRSPTRARNLRAAFNDRDAIQRRRRNSGDAPRADRRIRRRGCSFRWITRRREVAAASRSADECHPGYADLVLRRRAGLPGCGRRRPLRGIARCRPMADTHRTELRPRLRPSRALPWGIVEAATVAVAFIVLGPALELRRPASRQTAQPITDRSICTSSYPKRRRARHGPVSVTPRCARMAARDRAT